MNTTPAAPGSHGTRHPIAVVSERTGLSQDVLRIWERRYGAVAPIRSPGGERLYSDGDVERLRLLEAAVSAGRRIGQVAHLATPELALLVAGDRAAKPPRTAIEAEPENEVAAVLVDAAMEHVHALEPRLLEDGLRRGIAIEGTGGFVRRIAVPLLRRIGDEWHTGRLTIAAEHFASAVIEGMLVEAMRAVRPVAGAPRLVVATPPGSHHVIAAAMAGAIAAAEGWDVFFLGGDLPAAEIAAAARARSADAVALSVLYAADPDGLGVELRTLRDRLPEATPLILGGRAVRDVAGALAGLHGIEIGETLDDLRDMLRRPGWA